jgi:hypothetical protein
MREVPVGHDLQRLNTGGIKRPRKFMQRRVGRVPRPRHLVWLASRGDGEKPELEFDKPVAFLFLL